MTFAQKTRTNMSIITCGKIHFSLVAGFLFLSVCGLFSCLCSSECVQCLGRYFVLLSLWFSTCCSNRYFGDKSRKAQVLFHICIYRNRKCSRSNVSCVPGCFSAKCVHDITRNIHTIHILCSLSCFHGGFIWFSYFSLRFARHHSPHTTIVRLWMASFLVLEIRLG